MEMELLDKRFSPTAERPQLKQLWDSHHEILRLHALGYKNVDIARIVKCTPQTVSNTLASNVAQGTIQKFRQKRDKDAESILNRIQRILPKCMDILEETIKDEEIPLSVRLKEANTLLDRGGFGKVIKTENKTLHAHLTKTDIEEMKERMAQAVTG